MPDHLTADLCDPGGVRTGRRQMRRGRSPLTSS
jgi:hypothetical protein